MANIPLLTFNDLSLTFGGEPLFAGLSGMIGEGDRIALVGRNGTGKSTLLKMLARQVEPDTGEVVLPQGIHSAVMEQDPDLSGYATLGDFAEATLPPGEGWRIEAAAEGLGFDPAISASAASGGETRRAALAAVLGAEADILFLDEPTNHLDINAILWLQETLQTIDKAYVLISHDRAFLTALTRRTFWVDRGVLRIGETGFGGFEAWRDKVWDEEDKDRHNLDKKIKSESRWAVEGISARRKRNMGRVRRLQDMRGERAAQVRRQGAAAMELGEAEASGKRVIEARGLSKAYDGKAIVTDFSMRIGRGDRVAFVGPNGVGKTTLLKMLTGEITPDQGSVKLGTNLEMAVFDQARAAIDPDATLWTALTEDKAIGAGKNDQVMVRGHARHVVSYLKDFLFDERQARGPVSRLSGGEKARLLLARIMARESNLLVLDEPTNDLDVETLDLLQELLDAYSGTVLLVSHDRDFIDRVATQTVAMEGNGRAVVYAGGWTDYRAQRGDAMPAAKKPSAKRPAAKAAAVKTEAPKDGLTYTERHRLEALPGELERLEAEIGKLEAFLADPDLFSREPKKFEKASTALAERQETLAAAEEEWLMLAEKDGG